MSLRTRASRPNSRLGKRYESKFFSYKSFAVACFIISLPFSAITYKYSGGNSTIQAGTLLIGLLFLTTLRKSPEFVMWFRSQSPGLLITLAISATFLSIFLNFGFSTIGKGLILLLFFILIPLSIPKISEHSFLRGCFIAAIINTLLLIFSFDAWNLNALCLNIASITTLFIATIAARGGTFNKKLFFVIIGIGSMTIIFFGSRTALGSVLIANGLFVLSYSKFITPSKLKVMVFILVVFICSSTRIGYVYKELAINFKNSEGLLFDFWLGDKDIEKILDDPLDRDFPWTAAIETIKSSPVIGVGYQRHIPPEFAEGKVNWRAHNAFLEIGYKCGIPSMVFWAIFYLSVFRYSFEVMHNGQMGYLFFTTSCILLVYSTMESNGILSLSNSVNWISICCFVHFVHRSRFAYFQKNKKARRQPVI